MLVALSTFGWFFAGSGKWYDFWSGFGSDLTELAILGIVYRKVNCHQNGCWRIGLHKVLGTPYIVCKRHHPGLPDGKVTARHILDAHDRAKAEHLGEAQHSGERGRPERSADLQ
jgi:hypothetical protein